MLMHMFNKLYVKTFVITRKIQNQSLPAVENEV